MLGFSMGGGVICEFLRLRDDQQPAQVVLLNTYYDLPLLVHDLVPIPGISQLMRTQWIADAGLQKYALRPGNLLVVAAMDDELIPVKHSYMLLNAIQHSTNITKNHILLPFGGHNNSIETHFPLWIPLLLPSIIK